MMVKETKVLFMTITTNEHGQQNMFAKEPQMYIDPIVEEQMDKNVYETHNEKAEKLNGRFAMIGIMAALLNYASTGQIIPGVW
jgi:hypothetical protein